MSHKVNPDLKKLAVGASVTKEVKDYLMFEAVRTSCTIGKVAGNILTNWVIGTRFKMYYDPILKDQYLKHRLDQKPKEKVRKRSTLGRGEFSIKAWKNHNKKKDKKI